MRLKSLLLAACVAWFALQGCDFGSAPTGGGTGGDAITGNIVDSRGTPVQGARVWLYPDSSDLAKRAMTVVFTGDSTLTNKAGRFTFTRVPAGRYALTAVYTRNDSTFAWRKGGVAFTGSGNLDLGVDTLQPSGSLYVFAGDANAQAISGAGCTIVASPWSAISDSAGDCVFNNIGAGDLQVRVTAPGRSAVTSPVTVPSGGISRGNPVYLYRPGETGTPSQWIQASAQEYVFSIPPTLEIQSEGTVIDSWDASYKSATSTVSITALLYVPILERPQTLPGYREDTVLLEANLRAVHVAYRDSTGNYRVGVQIEEISPPQRLITFRGSGTSSADSAQLSQVMRSVRKWTGVGQPPVAKPPRPVLKYPLPGAVHVLVDDGFQWSSTMRKDYSLTLKYYRFQLSRDSSFSVLLRNDSVPQFNGTFTYHPGMLGPSTRYYWRVLAVGAGGLTSSTVNSFLSQPATLPRVLLSPANGAINVSLLPNFTWQVDTSGSTYGFLQVIVSTDSNLNAPAINSNIPQNQPIVNGVHSVTLDSLKPGTKYYWGIVTGGGFFESSASAVWSFTTQ